MKNNHYHNPWGSASADKSRMSFNNFGTRLPDIIRRALTCASEYIRRVASWWSCSLHRLWRQGSTFADRLVAVGLFVAGIMGIVFLGFLLIYLIPFLILAAVVAAVIANFFVNKDRFR
ncbi:MAG: hypothetical protein PF904_04700 [Kiritimatiellae bacterium]|jgi:hypothetical protein|nr:hypothetical protein [Kiritimatiellia bacterium]